MTIGRSFEMAGEINHRANIVLPGFGPRFADGHIFQHTLAQRTDGFVRLSHGSVSCVVG